MRTDAFNRAIDAALVQQDVDGTLGFFSSKLSGAEQQYFTYDRDFFAIFAATNIFQRILEGCQFVIYTDYRPFTFMLAQLFDKASPRHARQLEFISKRSFRQVSARTSSAGSSNMCQLLTVHHYNRARIQ